MLQPALVVIRKEDLTGNGDTNIFGWKPKIAIFQSMGKDENLMSLDQNSGPGLGGKISRFGSGFGVSLESETFHEDVDLPASTGGRKEGGKGRHWPFWRYSEACKRGVANV